jgi:hypothetical protein
MTNSCAYRLITCSLCFPQSEWSHAYNIKCKIYGVITSEASDHEFIGKNVTATQKKTHTSYACVQRRLFELLFATISVIDHIICKHSHNAELATCCHSNNAVPFVFLLRQQYSFLAGRQCQILLEIYPQITPETYVTLDNQTPCVGATHCTLIQHNVKQTRPDEACILSAYVNDRKVTRSDSMYLGGRWINTIIY